MRIGRLEGDFLDTVTVKKSRDVLGTKLSDDAFTGNRQDEFIRVIRADYEAIRHQYLSFWKLLTGLFKPDILGYKPVLEK